MAPLIVILVFLKVDLEEPLEDKFKQIGLACGQVIFAWQSLHLSIFLILSESGPKFEGLGSNLVTVRVGSGSCNLADSLEVNLNRLVLLCANLLKSVQARLSNFFICAVASDEDLLHDVVPFSRHREILSSVRYSIWQSLDRQLRWLNSVWGCRDVVDER
jgi:hypothetical protein